MKKFWMYFLLTFAVTGLFGCANSKMQLVDMWNVPKLQDGESYWLTYFVANPKLVVADAAIMKEQGVKDASFAWEVGHFPAAEKGNKFNPLITFRMKDKDGKQVFPVLIPENLKPQSDDKVILPDHGGTRICNQSGNYIFAAEGWRKMNPFDPKYQGFITTFGTAGFTLIKKGDPGFTEVDNDIREKANLIWNDLEKIRKKWGITVGTTLSKDTIERIEKSGDADWLMEVLGSNWYIALTYPILSPVHYGAYIFLAKVFAITGKMWQDDPNKPGRMDRVLKAGEALDMFELKDQLFPAAPPKTSLVVSCDTPITEKDKEVIKGGPCDTAGTYCEYQNCILKINKDREERNRKVREYNERILSKQKQP